MSGRLNCSMDVKDSNLRRTSHSFCFSLLMLQATSFLNYLTCFNDYNSSRRYKYAYVKCCDLELEGTALELGALSNQPIIRDLQDSIASSLCARCQVFQRFSTPSSIAASSNPRATTLLWKIAQEKKQGTPSPSNMKVIRLAISSYNRTPPNGNS